MPCESPLFTAIQTVVCFHGGPQFRIGHIFQLARAKFYVTQIRVDFNWIYGKDRSGTVPGAIATPAPLTRSLPLPVPYRAATRAI